MTALAQEKICTINDIYALPDGECAELIDGQIYMMAPLSRKHQTIVRELFSSINSYIKLKGGFLSLFLHHLLYFWIKMIQTMSSRIYP